MKKLSEIHPQLLDNNPDDWFTGFLRSLLIRTNFMVNVRHRLGWRGLKPTFRNGEGWTCRIHNSKGVYGISYDHSSKNTGWLSGNYKVYYFPTKEDDRIEQFSLEAAIASQQVDYINHVREFLCYPEFASLFEIATINISISQDQQAIICALVAYQNIKTISPVEVCCEVDGEGCMLIEPGGIDQNLPAFELTLPLFNVLAATLTYNFDESPAFVKQTRTQQEKIEKLENTSDSIELSLGYNSKWFLKNKDFSPHNELAPIEVECFWESESGQPKPFADNPFWQAHLQQSSRFEKSHVDAEERPQFILLSGFLGSGKTTFLKRFIEYHTTNNRFVAVIQNEIGETGLDGKLLEDNYAVLEIDEGCVCCSLIGQLKKGIFEILSNHKPDVIILETTGLANPLNLLAEIEEIRELIRFDSITTIVDAQNFAAAAACSKVVYDQIKCANAILLSKIDLLTKNEINGIKRELHLLNPDAIITPCIKGDVNPALLYTEREQCNYFAKQDKMLVYAASTHKDAGLGSIKINFNEPLDRAIFLKKLKNLPASIFRIKGILNFTDSIDAFVFQYVNGIFDLSPVSGDAYHEYFLILIGENDSLSFLNQIYFTN